MGREEVYDRGRKRMSNKPARIYKVSFYNQGSVYELYAKQIHQSSIYGFIELSELTFNAVSNVVVDPMEERLKNEFGGVKITYVPMHSIIRIDEVEKEGTAKIHELTERNVNKIAAFPTPIYTPPTPK